MNMAASPAERRQSLRHKLALPWPACATIHGETINAEMIDVSLDGAKIRLLDFAIHRIMSPGYEADWTVKHPGGNKITFHALVRWLHRFPDGFVLGVYFIDGDNNIFIQEIRQLSKE